MGTYKLFMGHAENIAHSLNVTSCYVCGTIFMRYQWHWEAKGWDPRENITKILRDKKTRMVARKSPLKGAAIFSF